MCNDKLIGAWEYAYNMLPASRSTETPTPEDKNGHGSHTSSTTVSNQLHSTMEASTLELTRIISGVAPNANIIIFDAGGLVTTQITLTVTGYLLNLPFVVCP